MMKTPRRIHLLISGRVQGVFFRVRCQTLAQRLGLSGWVRNLGDGRVEVLAEGEAEDVGQLLDWCRQGPSGGRVEEVIVDEALPQGDQMSFRIEQDG